MQMSDPIAYSASSDPDTMYIDQAMKQPDQKQSIKAMVNEVAAHTNSGHWKLLLKSKIEENTYFLCSILSCSCKEGLWHLDHLTDCCSAT